MSRHFRVKVGIALHDVWKAQPTHECSFSKIEHHLIIWEYICRLCRHELNTINSDKTHFPCGSTPRQWKSRGVSVALLPVGFLSGHISLHLNDNLMQTTYVNNLVVSFKETRLDYLYVGVSIDGGSPKWLVCGGISYYNGWFRGNPISGILHVASGKSLSAKCCDDIIPICWAFISFVTGRVHHHSW